MLDGMELTVREASAETWHDVAAVLGENGGYSGCWCMFWRQTNRETQASDAHGNRTALKQLVEDPVGAGLLAYGADGTPVGWCQVAPRPGFRRLFHTRGLDLDDPDDASVWSIVCVFVVEAGRGVGVSDALVAAATDFARRHGGTHVEGYPVAQHTGRKTQLSSGTVALFTRAGFQLVGTVSGRRAVMRRTPS